MTDLNVAGLVLTITSTRIVSVCCGVFLWASGYNQSRTIASCITILIYDSLLTFDKELKTIWTSKWHVTKVMYVLTRYSAIFEAGGLIYQLSIPGEKYRQCSIAFKLNTFLFVFGLGVGEIIMTVRTWAVWGKSRFLMYFLPIFCIIMWTGGFTATGIFLSTLEFRPHPVVPYVGCYTTHASPILFVSWVLLLVYDLVMFILMSIPAFKALRIGGTSRLAVVIYRDASYTMLVFSFCPL
ncbi:hypothetical protein CPC08DRAFT_537850 [Agrocybe pediades]|nr:hypothetical protein CPC08DRAFT_537850 [Agrocybe pediades]